MKWWVVVKASNLSGGSDIGGINFSSVNVVNCDILGLVEWNHTLSIVNWASW